MKPTQKSQPVKHKSRFINNSTAAQRARLLDLLRITDLTTTELRDQYSIMHPAGRIKELRKQGYDILLEWIEQYDAAGVPHRAGRYRLIVEGETCTA